MKFPEEKRDAAKEATKLKRFATVEVSYSSQFDESVARIC
jgi:hypothetical protein